MLGDKSKRDMAALRAAHRLRMEELRRENQKKREEEESRKAELYRRIQLKEDEERRRQEEKALAEKNRIKNCLKQARDLIRKHQDALVLKYSQLIQNDGYGNLIVDKWEKERRYFISRIIYPSIGGKDCGVENSELEKLVESAVKRREKRQVERNEVANIDHISPIEYEIFCAAQLQRSGWKTVLTKTSGDQGVDVVADKGKKRLAIQCKKYSSPVGNSAVQEICAGVKFVQANFGAVVSNASFTPQARQLAESANILLLHHSELENIDSLLKKMAIKLARV